MLFNMNIKLIVLTGICLLVGYCQGAETPLDTTRTRNLPTETTITTSSTTTPTPPQSKTWVVVDKTSNEACILAHIISEFNFTYPVEIKANANIATGNTIIIVPLDNSTEARPQCCYRTLNWHITGLCANSSQSITFKWKENSVEIDFKIGEDKNFFVSLNTLNKTDQQNCSETISTYKKDATLFKTQVDMTYKCDKVQHVTVTAVSGDSSAILSISHTKFQAIRKKKGNGPGLILRPKAFNTNFESPLIWFKAPDYENIKFWTNQLDDFLEEYRKPTSENVQSCRHDRLPQPGKVCDVPVREIYPCITENKYNYNRRGPCIFLQLNQIYGWKPIMYNDTTELPDKMPQELKSYIEEAKGYNPEWVNTVWVSCEGENPADVENIGPIHYTPAHGFPGFFFPYLKQEGYMSPIVAVYFERPATGVLINVICKAWAQNIDNDDLESTGSIHFVIMVDKA